LPGYGDGVTDTSRTLSETSTRRLTLLVVGVVVVILGLSTRFALPGTLGDVAGGLFYAFCVYIVLAMIVPQARPIILASIAFALCAAVELLQLTDFPSTLAQLIPPARLVLGTTFAWSDLLVALVGVLIALLTDVIGQINRRRRVERSQASARNTATRGV
jgi:hypothetical protein